MAVIMCERTFESIYIVQVFKGTLFPMQLLSREEANRIKILTHLPGGDG